MKREQHHLAGQAVIIKRGSLAGEEYKIDDWQINVYGGQSWMHANGNPAALDYDALRGGRENLPIDDNVLYGKIGSFGKMIHISELGSEAA